MTDTTLTDAARAAVRALRRAAYRLQDQGDPEAAEMLAAADQLADALTAQAAAAATEGIRRS